MDPFDANRRVYTEAPKRVREALARTLVDDLLNLAYTPAERILAASDAQVINGLRRYVLQLRAVEPAWDPIAETVPAIPVKALRAELCTASETIRHFAEAIALGSPTQAIPMTVQLEMSDPVADWAGRPRWFLRGRLSDAIVWMAAKAFSAVPRTLIRRCQFPDCLRIYLATKNQRYCARHQVEAHLQAQRRAERSFRTRQRQAKKRRPRK